MFVATLVLILVVLLALIVVPMAMPLARRHGRQDPPGRHASPAHPIRERRPLARRRSNVGS